jgi:hypothetical protein
MATSSSGDTAWDDRLRFIVNALTRLRVVDAEGRMHIKFKGSAAKAPDGTMPWFDHPDRASRASPIVFGHWSTEGLVRRSNVIGLDTGCVWGGQLTALRLDDGALFQVDCLQRRSAATSPRYRRSARPALRPARSPDSADARARQVPALVRRASSAGRNAPISRSSATSTLASDVTGPYRQRTQRRR